MSRFVKITAHLASPLCLSDEGVCTHIDSLVAYRSAQLSTAICATGRHIQSPVNGGKITNPQALWTPFESTTVEGIRVPHCSSGIYSGPESVERIAKQFPMLYGDLVKEKERTQINTTGGEFKSYYLPLRTVQTPQVVWFCHVKGGEKNKPAYLRRLLQRITHIGHKANLGYGRVVRWDAERIEQDYSWYAPHPEQPSSKILMRPLPLSLLDKQAVGWKRDFGGCAHPYWDREFYREIAVPYVD